MTEVDRVLAAVRHALRRVGLAGRPGRRGLYLFRHTLATQLLAAGHGPKSRDRELPFREDIEQHRFELLVHFVHLVDQQDARLRYVLKCAHDWSLHEKVQGMEPGPNELPIRAELVRLCFEEELLQSGIELSNGLFFIDTRVALKSFHYRVKSKCQGFRKLCLAASRVALQLVPVSLALPRRTPGRASPHQQCTWLPGISGGAHQWIETRWIVSSARILGEDSVFTENPSANSRGGTVNWEG